MSNLPPGIVPVGLPQTFEEHLLRVNPTEASLQNLARQPDDGPIVMLNLLRFNPRGDSRVYSLYGKRAASEISKVDSFVADFGMAIHGLDAKLGFDDSWDSVVLPVYHRRRAFLELQLSPVYQRAIAFRTAGTSARLLYVLRDGEQMLPACSSIAAIDRGRETLRKPGEVVVVELLRFRQPAGRTELQGSAERTLSLLRRVDAQILLSVDTETPIVSGQYWDHVILTWFPSREAAVSLIVSDAWKELQANRASALDDSLRLATTAAGLPG